MVAVVLARPFEIPDTFKNIVLLHHIGCLYSLHDQLVTAVSHFGIFVLQSVTDFEEFDTFFLPDGCYGGVISLEEF